MSYDIPAAIEPDIREYAESEHITADEAIVRLIQTGLSATRSGPKQSRAKESTRDVFEVLQEARAMRTVAEPITATQFFEEIQTTTGFETKAAAREHLQELRNEWR